MSLLLFHQGNVPIIEDDMKFVEIKLENNKASGKNWAGIGFVTEKDVLSQIMVDLIHSRIDGIRLVMDLTASQAPSSPKATQIVGFPYYYLDFDNQELTIEVNKSGIEMPIDDQSQIIDYIILYADGDFNIQLIDYPDNR